MQLWSSVRCFILRKEGLYSWLLLFLGAEQLAEHLWYRPQNYLVSGR